MKKTREKKKLKLNLLFKEKHKSPRRVTSFRIKMSSFSVFIPRVFTNIGEKRISNVFHDQNIGQVSKVDLVRRTNDKGESFNMAFVHFEYLYKTTHAEQFRKDVENPELKAKLEYEAPWFWLVLPYEEKEKPVQEQQSYYPQDQHNYYPQDQQNFFMGYGTMMMTPQGPMWYPMQAAPNQMVQPPNQMVPPQVAYGNRPNRHRSHPKKRINVPKKDETPKEKEEGTLDYGNWKPPIKKRRPISPAMPPPIKEDGETD